MSASMMSFHVVLFAVLLALPTLMHMLPTMDESEPPGRTLTRNKRLLIDVPRYDTDPQDCGTIYLGNHSINGPSRKKRMSQSKKAYWGEYPSFVQIFSNDRDPVSGVLITNRIVLSAYRCYRMIRHDNAYENFFEGAFVRAGTNRRYRRENENTDAIVTRSCWVPRSPGKDAYDFVVMILNKELNSNVTSRVKPICLPKTQLDENAVLKVVGMGAYKVDPEDGLELYPEFTRVIEAKVILSDPIRETLKLRPLNPATKICHGDCGNPIISIEEGKHVIRGMVKYQHDATEKFDCTKPKPVFFGADVHRLISVIRATVNDCIDLENRLSKK